MGKKYFLFFLCAVAQLTATPPPVPSAGVVERELEKEYEGKPLEPNKEVPSIQIDIPKSTLKIGDGKKVLIHQIEIKGNNSISSKKIISWLKDYLSCELSLQQIYELCHIIDLHYANKGYFLARAYPPPQDIANNTLTIEVIEGKLGNVEVIGNNHYTAAFIKSYFTALQGKPLCYNEFLRRLMILNENTDLAVGALFEKGKEFGCADVILRVNDARPIHLYLNGNNYGRNLTTNVRVGGRFDWGNLVTQGDAFSIAEVVGFPIDALYFTDVRYTIPVNRTGTSLEGAYLYSQFKIEELTSLHLKGRSSIATLKVNQALLRRKEMTIDLFSYFDYKQIQNLVMGYVTSYDKLRVLTIGGLIDHFVQGQARNYLNMRLAGGIPNLLGGLSAVDAQSSRKGGGGRFFILTADYDRIQHLPKGCFLYCHATGQYSPSKLTLPEQIYIGGVDTVRGFPLAIALGDSGYYANIEFRFPPPFLGQAKFFGTKKKWADILQFDTFLDQGGVFLQSVRNMYLCGTGAGIRINGPWTLNLSIDVGFPLNHRRETRDIFTYIKLTCQPF